jgi:hypothetical protein
MKSSPIDEYHLPQMYSEKKFGCRREIILPQEKIIYPEDETIFILRRKIIFQER